MLSVESTPPALVCRAIREHLRLAFEYSGHARVVEPYAHGVSTAGREVLRAVQVGGRSDSGHFGEGKLWLLQKMQNVELREPFSPSDPNYHPEDSAMKHIHCRVEGRAPGARRLRRR